MARLNVLFLNSWYPNEELPFNGNFIQQHARAVSLYCNVVSLHVQSRTQEKELEVSKRWNNGVFEIIVYYNKIESNTFFSKFKKKKRQHKAFLEGFNSAISEFIKIDIVHLNVIFSAGVFAVYLKQKLNIPFIVTEHSTTYLNISPVKHSLIETYFIKKVLKHSAFICPVSKDLGEALKKLNNHLKIKVIPNVVNTDFFKYAEKDSQSKNIKLLHISSLKEEHKNVKGIFNVIKKLSEVRNDFNITIVSDKCSNDIEKHALQIGLNKQFYNFEGEKSIKDIAKIMYLHDIFILFSNYENSPCVISESLVSGIPVLSSNVGGINEMINNENGILVEPRDEDQLFKELNNMMSNLSYYEGTDISRKAIETYSYESVGRQFLQLYNDVLKI